MGGLAVDGGLEPEDAVVADADIASRATFADDDVIGVDVLVADDVACAEIAAGLLIGGQGEFDVEVRLDLQVAEGLEGEEDGGDGALHVAAAAAIDPSCVDLGLEGSVSPLAGGGDDVVVAVEVEGLGSTAVEVGEEAGRG